jgi:RNA polymerase sigma-70 factor (ECF subfamily)
MVEPELEGQQVADRELVRRLLAGDEYAFEGLVRRLHASMVRTARAYVPSHAVAEEVVQDTWAAVIGGLHRFEGRSTLKTWIFRILLNRARTQGTRERRIPPVSALTNGCRTTDVGRRRFPSSAHPFHVDLWGVAPSTFPTVPEDHAVNTEMRGVITDAIAELTPRQRLIITLRDVDGWSPAEVCETLGISDGNQRVLLHRARSAVRVELERRFTLVGATSGTHA